MGMLSSESTLLGLAGVAAAQWLAVRLQLLAAVLVAAVALLAVLGRAGLLPWTLAHSDRCAHGAPAGAPALKGTVGFTGGHQR